MPDDGRVTQARNAAWTHLRSLLPTEQWNAVSKGLDKVLRGASDSDLWLDALRNVSHLSDAGKVGVIQLLMQAGRGASLDNIRQELDTYSIAGEPDYEQGVVQTPGLQDAMQAWEAAGLPSEGQAATNYDRQFAEGQTRFQKLQAAGLLGQATQPQPAPGAPATLQGQAAQGTQTRRAAFDSLMAELSRQ